MIHNPNLNSIYTISQYTDLYRNHVFLVLSVLLMLTACQVDKPLPQIEIEQGGTSNSDDEMNTDSTTPSAGEEAMPMLDTPDQQMITHDSMAGSETSSGGTTASSDSNDSTPSGSNLPNTDDTQDVECSTPNPSLSCLDIGCDEGSECVDLGGCFPSNCYCEQGEWACTFDCIPGYECRPIEHAQLCGVRGTETCPEGTFCNHPPESQCGSLNVPGTCRSLETSCPRIDAPVCGCDGITYANECTALSTGMSIRYVGECTTEPCLNDADQDGICDDQDTQCNLYGHAQVCLRSPPTCEAGHVGYMVVDGCYLGCFWSWDQCNPDRLIRLEIGDTCGNDVAVCPDGTYCKFDEVSMCGSVDTSNGTCTPLGPSICPQINDPVCGCDGRRYANACQAEAFGMSIIQNGECTALRCGGTDAQSLQTCPDGMECRLDPNDECNPENGDTDCPRVCVRNP